MVEQYNIYLFGIKDQNLIGLEGYFKVWRHLVMLECYYRHVNRNKVEFIIANQTNLVKILHWDNLSILLYVLTGRSCISCAGG